MANLSITKQHQLTHAKAKAAAEKVAQELRERFELDYRWHGDSIAFKRPGLTGELHVGARDVRLEAQLGFFLLMFKPTIEQAVQREFARHFGEASAPPRR